MVNNEDAQATQEMQEQAPKGRAALLALYKTRNPETSDDPDDDMLFDWAGKGYSEFDEIKGRYEGLNASNERLASVVGEDPRFAKFIALVANGKNPMYALGSIFGNILDELSADDLEKLRAGQEEFKSRFNQVKDNFNSYVATLKKYGADNNLDEDMLNRIDDTIMDIADAFADRNIPEELIKVIHTGLDAENILEKATELTEAERAAERSAGANEAIDAFKGKKTETSPVPDMVANKNESDNSMRKQRFNDKKPKSYTDKLKVVPKT